MHAIDVVNYSLLNNPPAPKLPAAKQAKLNMSREFRQQQELLDIEAMQDQQPSLSMVSTLSSDWTLPSPPSNSALAASLSVSLLANPLSNLDPANLLSTRVEVDLSAEDKKSREVALIERVYECAETNQARIGMGHQMGMGMDDLALLTGNAGDGLSGLGEEEKKSWCRLLLDNVSRSSL